MGRNAVVLVEGDVRLRELIIRNFVLWFSIVSSSLTLRFWLVETTFRVIVRFRTRRRRRFCSVCFKKYGVIGFSYRFVMLRRFVFFMFVFLLSVILLL